MISPRNGFRRRTCLGLTLALVAFTSIGAKAPAVVMRYDPDKPNRKSAILWLAYVISRTAFREEHNLPIPPSGEILPSLDEEVHARTMTVQTYRTLKAKDPAMKDAYWDALSEVERKGFMAAYAWSFLRRRDWPSSVRPSDLVRFNAWKQHALPKHVPQTYSWLESGKP
jgi:hypothetical protein